jgi:hypothetical protein
LSLFHIVQTGYETHPALQCREIFYFHFNDIEKCNEIPAN